MFIGKDGFIWWIGVVESNLDPEVLGRCKVRIFGYHPAHSEAKVSNDELPWAVAIHPINTPNLFATPQPGEWVFGFFLDGQDAKEPAILGYVPANPENSNPTFASKGSPSQSTEASMFGAVRQVISSIRNFKRNSTKTGVENANTVTWQYGDHVIEMVKNGDITISHRNNASYIVFDTKGSINIVSSNSIYVTAAEDFVVESKNTIFRNKENFTSSSNNFTSVANNFTATITKDVKITSNTAVITNKDITFNSNNITAIANTGLFDIKNVTFTSNNVSVEANTGNFDINSISVSGNTAVFDLTSIQVAANTGNFEITSVDFSGNNITFDVQDVSFNSTTGNFSISGVTFSSNTISLNTSGGISIEAGGTLTLNGSTVNLG